MDNGSTTKKVLAIFFDLDNTLIATRKADSLACNKLSELLRESHGINGDVAKKQCASFLRSFRKCPAHENMDLDAWRCFLWTEALGKQYNELTEEVYKKWLELRFRYLALSPEIKALLRSLRQHYFVGLITNGPSAAQWEKVDRLALKAFFDVILVSGDLPWEKPHYKIFHEACDYLGIGPQHCVMVGDKLDTDILGGIQAELGGTVWVPLVSREIDPSEPQPDFIIKNVTELPSLLPAMKNVPKFRRSSKLKGFNRGVCMSDLEDSNSNSSDGS